MEIFSGFKIIWESWPMFLNGTVKAVELCILFLAVGIIVAIPVSLSQIYGGRVVRFGASVFERCFEAFQLWFCCFCSILDLQN